MNKRNTIKRSFAAIFYVVSALLIFISIYLELDPRFQVSVQDKLVQSAIIILSLSIATLFTVRLYVEQKKRIIIIKFSVFILFIYYLFILIYMLFLDKYSGRNNAILPYQNYDLYFKNHTNFIPFATIVDYFNGWRYHTINRSSILTNLIGNIIAFMPMGIFLPLLFKPLKKTWIFIFTVGIFIMLLETIQLLTLTGSCDIDDLILNLTGAILAFGFIKLISLQKLFE